MKSARLTAPLSPSVRERTDTAPALGLPVAHYEHVGNLLDLGLADLVAGLLVAVVHLDAEALRSSVGDLLGRIRRAGRLSGITIACTGASHSGNAPA